MRWSWFCFLQNQTQATETQIKADFEQLREFLRLEETARLAALQQESEEKTELVRKKSEGVTTGILTFSHAVIAVENEIASADGLFLKVGCDEQPGVWSQSPEVAKIFTHRAEVKGSLFSFSEL